jgi:ubiquinone/menaquinone biosynthesis C-methylase UbiE
LRWKLKRAATSLPFPDASFDTVTCTLSLCNIPDDHTAVAEMWWVLRPGGRVLLDHIGSHIWPIRMGQRLIEAFTIRAAGEHMTRRPLALVEGAGFVVDERERLKAGTVERVAARKPASVQQSPQ